MHFRRRKLLDGVGEARILMIRRLRCSGCLKVHHELPDCIVPYKRYEAECIEQVVTESESLLTVAVDDSTVYRWKRWFAVMSAYLLDTLNAIANRYPEIPVESPSALSQSAHQKNGRVSTDPPGWLARVVRPVVNMSNWIYTRSALASVSF
jgi:hypothetical protein